MSNTIPGALDALRSGGKVKFDPTINLGHVLTFVGFLGVMVTGYLNIDKRLSAQEMRSEMIVREIDAEKARTGGSLLEIKQDMKEIRRGVDQLRERKP